MPPEVSVVMSVYNGERFLQEAVRSILDQTFPDFEYIIVDDGSTDQTASILGSFDDQRIRLIYNPENLGLTASLNKGIDAAQGEFIARMDADDVSLPSRLEKQVSYLRSHPDIGVVGTDKQDIDLEGRYLEKNWNPPTLPGYVGWRLYFGNPIIHPSVMIRKRCLENVGLYDNYKRTAQDYDLWMRLSRVTKLSNLNEVLILYRRHSRSITNIKYTEQSEMSYQIRQQAVQRLIGIVPKVDELIMLERCCPGNYDVAKSSLRLLLQLYRSYSKVNSLTLEERIRIRQNTGRKIFKIANANRDSKRIWYYFLLAFWFQPTCVILGMKAIARRLASFQKRGLS
jgi:glycosyltransferase involved in cell wall biosynthesis